MAAAAGSKGSSNLSSRKSLIFDEMMLVCGALKALGPRNCRALQGLAPCAATRQAPRTPAIGLRTGFFACMAACNFHYFHYYRIMEEMEVIASLAALAQPARLRLYRALVTVGTPGLTPGVMAHDLGMAPATLSFHLKELVNAGLVTQERSSRNLIYRAAYARMNALLDYLTENCCQGDVCRVAAQTACPC